MKRVLAVLCALLLVFGADEATGQGRKSRSKPRVTKNKSQLQGELSALRNRKAELRKELQSTKRETKEVLGDIYVVDARLERLEDQVRETNAGLRQSRREQVKLGSQLDEASKRVTVVKTQVAKRMRHMYVNQGESVVSALIGVRSVGDIASRKVLVQAIAKKDRQLFDEYRRLRETIDDRKSRQDKLVVKIDRLRRRQVDQQATLEVTREQKAETLSDLRTKQQRIQNLIAQFDQDERSVASQIRAMSAARRRRPRMPGQPPVVAFSGLFARPSNGRISSGYGMRFHPILRRNRVHAGIDFAAGSGSPIMAAASGEVIVAQYSRSYGNMLVIDHGGGISTLYAHASRLYVSAGQTVSRGQVIAAVGSTGLSSGPHLHWEVRVNGSPVNPGSRM